MTQEEEEEGGVFLTSGSSFKVKVKSTGTAAAAAAEAVNHQTPSSSRDTARPRPFQHVYMRTAFLYALFFYLGMTASLLGTTLVHLKVYLHEDSATLWSMALVIFSIGYLVGGLLCGFLFDRFNWEMLFTLSGGMLALTVIMSQFSSSFYHFVFGCTTYSVAMGYVDAAAQTYGVSLWTGRKQKEPIIQMVHVIWSAGAMLGPFIIRPFLVPLPPATATATATATALPFTTAAAADGDAWTDVVNSNSSSSSIVDDVIVHDVSRLRYAFIVIGLIGIVPTVCFAYAFCRYTSRTCVNAARTKSRSRSGSRDGDPGQGQSQGLRGGEADGEDANDVTATAAEGAEGKGRYNSNPPRNFLMLVYAMLALFFSSYLIVELTPGTLLGLFVVDGLGWEATSVSPVMSTFWGFHCLGRLVGVPVSMVLSPAPMLVINFTILFVAFGLMLVGALFSDWLVWVSIAGSAFGMASTFATGVLLAAQYIPFGGTAASVVIVAASVGGAAGPPLATFLFGSFGHMTFVYLLMAATSVLASSFVLLYLLLRTSQSKRWSKAKK